MARRSCGLVAAPIMSGWPQPLSATRPTSIPARRTCNSQTFYGNLSTIATSGGTLFPLQVPPIDKTGNVPTVYNFSAGLQRQLPSQVLLDVSYVGTQSRHLLEPTPFNALPFGSAWLPENQDP